LLEIAAGSCDPASNSPYRFAVGDTSATCAKFASSKQRSILQQFVKEKIRWRDMRFMRN
jgi:hypothetical protein